MEKAVKIILSLVLLIWLIAACSPRVYHPPKLGAEWRLQEGMKPQKDPMQLFDKKVRKHYEEKGVFSSKEQEDRIAKARQDSIIRYKEDEKGTGARMVMDPQKMKEMKEEENSEQQKQ